MDYKEKLKAIINSNKTPLVDINTLLKYFPELAEPEDEKIRKELLQIAKESEDSFYMVMTPNKREKLIAWLEKQGKKPDDNIESSVQNKPWSEDDNKHFERILKELKNQWQRPSNRPYLDEIVSDYYWLNSIKDRVQPKQEWSEEDKEFINDLIGVFDGQQYQAHSDEEIVKWLKSIRLPYNKEWDENDEEMLKSIIATCELACEDRDSSPARHLLEMQLDWLESLRPQSQWKPSDEQMLAINTAINVLGKGTLSGKQLIELQEDLKKLKG